MISTSMSEVEFLTRQEAAAIARCSTRTLDVAIRRGELRACRPGVRRVVVEKGELVRWLRHGSSEGAQR